MSERLTETEAAALRTYPPAPGALVTRAIVDEAVRRFIATHPDPLSLLRPCPRPEHHDAHDYEEDGEPLHCLGLAEGESTVPSLADQRTEALCACTYGQRCPDCRD